MVLKNPGIVGFVADAEMRVRAGLQPRPDGGMNLVGRRPGATAEQWEMFLDGRLRRRPRHRPHRLHRRRQQPVPAVVGRRQRQPAAAGRPRHRRWPTVLAEDPQYDVERRHVHPDTKEIQMVSFTKARTEHVVLDPSIADDVEAIQADPARRLHLPRPRPRRPHLAGRLHRRRRAGRLLRLGPGGQAGHVPVPPPAGPVRLHAGADGAVLLHRPRRAGDPRLPHVPARGRAARTCRRC